VPYRIDLRNPPAHAFDCLIELGAIDAECSRDGTLAALMPDGVAPEHLIEALGSRDFSIMPATARDDGSVWVLSPRAISVGRLRIVPDEMGLAHDALRLIDTPAFGTGLHPTTALCLEALAETVENATPDAVLDVGTGSGVLALAALKLGIPRAVALDIDEDARQTAAENARINGLSTRLQLIRGGPETLTGTWPLVLANISAGALIELAPALVRRVGPRGQLVLSGIPQSVEGDVAEAYRHLGMRRLRVNTRGGWIVLVLGASW
jgi:ribosomal protein L11 methyltransferase